ncbi:MAG TPA: helix-turn-helix domain-containing protein [Steroidobacteraceae bacterium]|nr:helix-turn-helix domain-containing protein [Steroidobacteraceae bacterium]
MAAFLDAAAAVITEKGYAQATMSAIAERARSCIGSLYQFFPNKPAVAEALRARYIADIEQSWAALGRQATDLSTEQLACRLVSLQVQIVTSHPGLLELLEVPPTAHTPTRRELIRARIVIVLLAHAPRIPKIAAARVAAVVQQISRGLLRLYARSDAEGKSAMIEEFEAVLIGYLVPKLRIWAIPRPAQSAASNDHSTARNAGDGRTA